MIEVLKSVHLLCLLLAGAASIGNGVLLRRVMASGAPADPLVAGAMGGLSKMGLGAILILWLTGVPLAIMTGAFAIGGWAFSAKLGAATILLGLVPAMTYLRGQMVAGRRPHDPKLIYRMLSVVRLLIVAAIVLAVVAFN